MRIFSRNLLLWMVAMSISAVVAAATDSQPNLLNAIAKIQHEWAKTTYVSPESQRETEFKKLAEKAHQVSLKFPDRAEPIIWEAIVLSSYANAEGGLDALDRVKQARQLLLKAEKIDPGALDGSVYTSLGSLHYMVPGWPISFGDNDKARDYLDKALAINPQGIDPNYFEGDFLFNQQDYEGAAAALHRALDAPPRPGREDADLGRRGEITKVLKQAEAHL